MAQISLSLSRMQAVKPNQRVDQHSAINYQQVAVPSLMNNWFDLL